MSKHSDDPAILSDDQREALKKLDTLLNKVGPIVRATVPALHPSSKQWRSMVDALVHAGYSSPGCNVVFDPSSNQYQFMLEDQGKVIRILSVPPVQIHSAKDSTVHIKEMVWDRLLKEVVHDALKSQAEQRSKLPWSRESSDPEADMRRMKEQMQAQPPPPPPAPPRTSPLNEPLQKLQSDLWKEIVSAYQDCTSQGYDTEEIGEILVTMVEQALAEHPPEEPQTVAVKDDSVWWESDSVGRAAEDQASKPFTQITNT